MKKVKIDCNFTIEVDFEDTLTDKDIKFLVEENSCPWTWKVWLTIEELIKKSNKKNICWACQNWKGTNKIVSITYESDKVFSN